MGEDEKASPPKFRRVFITDDASLHAILPELTSQSVVAVDLEMGQRVQRKPGGYQEWIHILALIQLAAGDLSVVVDPLRCSVTPLRELMAGRTRKVFLGGGQDAALLARAGIPARNIADVGEVAYALFGRREDGMAALARRIFGISLDKTVRRTDWMARPVNPTLLAYAHQDAELTLAIYEWFRQHHPEILRFHERRDFDPSLPPDAPEWLRAVLTRTSPDALAVVMEYRLDPAEHEQRLADDMRPYLTLIDAPRLLNKLLRVASDLRLVSLTADIAPFAGSPSSLLRASAARALGQVAPPDVAIPLLEQLKTDPIEDVRKAAGVALHDVRARQQAAEAVDDGEDDEPGLGDAALSALLQLKSQLEDGQGSQ